MMRLARASWYAPDLMYRVLKPIRIVTHLALLRLPPMGYECRGDATGCYQSDRWAIHPAVASKHGTLAASVWS